MTNTPDPDTIHRHTVNVAEAREQANEYDSLLRGDIIYSTDGEPFEVPHRDLFSNEQQRRWDNMMAERQEYDREGGITASDGTVIRAGDIKVPFRKDGKRVKSLINPKEFATDAEQQAIAIWGLDEATRADAAGVVFNEIPVVFAKQARRIRKWREADSKSADRNSGVAAAADSD